MPPERTILFGFSQGTMMALHVGLRRKTALAGIVGFSGRLLDPETLAAEVTSRPPVLLVHGDQRPHGPLRQPRAKPPPPSTAAGIEVNTHVSRGVGHGIAPDGLGSRSASSGSGSGSPADAAGVTKRYPPWPSFPCEPGKMSLSRGLSGIPGDI